MSVEKPKLRDMNPESFLELDERYQEYLFNCRKLWMRPAGITACLSEEYKKQFKYLILQKLERGYLVTDDDVMLWIKKVKDFYGISEERVVVAKEEYEMESRSDRKALKVISESLDRVENALEKLAEYLGIEIESEESEIEGKVGGSNCSEYLENCESCDQDMLLNDEMRSMEVIGEDEFVELIMDQCNETVMRCEDELRDYGYVCSMECRSAECIRNYRICENIIRTYRNGEFQKKLVEKYPKDAILLWEIKVTVGD